MPNDACHLESRDRAVGRPARRRRCVPRWTARLGPRYADRLDDIPPEVAARSRPGALGRPRHDRRDDHRGGCRGRLRRSCGAPRPRRCARGSPFAGSLEVKRVYRRAAGARHRREPPAHGASSSGSPRTAASNGSSCRPATGSPTPIALYEKIGYTPIPIYPPYVEITFSNCFEKPVARRDRIRPRGRRDRRAASWAPPPRGSSPGAGST